jgi:VCBS repeat-containing protein
MTRRIAMLVGLAMAFPAAAGTLAPEVQTALAALPAGGKLAVVVHLKDRADLGGIRGDRASRLRATIQALQSHAASTQGPIRSILQARLGAGGVAAFTPLWVMNGFALTATAPVIRLVGALPAVDVVNLDAIAVVETGTPPSGPAEVNVAATHAPDLWSLGYIGEGVVVATLDSGADASHPDIAARWRGGTNSWFDPYGQHATPFDPSGHGTWTLGVIVGGDAGGTTIGVAPGATWIAAKIFNDAGSATATAIHQAFQWVLDPDGNPNTADAPDIVNGSWAYGAPGCNLAFQADLQALRAAGILPVFAAGNFGPGANTSVSPANYPEALSVGATNSVGSIASDSGRGPSGCGGAVYPEVVAPGVNVLTSDLFSLYASVSGTSIAAPHVSGVAALLAGALPSSTADAIEQAVKQAAADLGVAGPDNVYGYGWVDARKAYDALLAPPPPSPPTAANDAFTVDQGATGALAAPGVLANDTDPGGLPLAAILATAPANGTLALQSSGAFTYTPNAGFSGSDGFTYKASNGQLESAVATVAITVTPRPPPAPPSAGNDAYSVAEDVTLSAGAPGVLSNDTAPSGQPLSAVLVAGPAHGTLALQANGGFNYSPTPNYYGADSFTYRASDGTQQSAAATVTITVTPVNDPPVAVNDVATTSRNVAVTIAVLANDTDVDGSIVASTLTLATSPRNGSVTKKANGTVVYTPKRSFTGTDSFTYTVKDNNGARSNVATVSVQVK